jgi:hypothetical protein
MQEWHSIRDMVIPGQQLNRDDGKIRPEKILQEEPQKDGHSRGDNRRTQKAAME